MKSVDSPRVVVALDFANPMRALGLAERLDPHDCGLKVGSELFAVAGPGPVHWMVDRGFNVFLDLKFHDIPNTVAQACAAATRLGVWMLNVHAAGGRAMLKAARDAVAATAAETGRTRPLLVGVTVLTSLVGSAYLPDWDGCILFLVDVEEAPYRIDRMLTQLHLAGILQKARAVIWGHCTDCDPGEGFGSLTVTDVLRDHLEPLGVPVWSGAMIGHIERQFTLPVGLEVEIDAAAGTIRMLEPAVLS